MADDDREVAGRASCRVCLGPLATHIEVNSGRCDPCWARGERAPAPGAPGDGECASCGDRMDYGEAEGGACHACRDGHGES